MGSSATRRIDHNITDIQGVSGLQNLHSDCLCGLIGDLCEL